jgi:hypothetical protein
VCQQGTTIIILAVPRILMTDLETGVQQGTTVIILAVPRMLMTELVRAAGRGRV